MVRPLILFLVLVILGAGIYFLIFKKNDNPYGKAEAAFTVKDTASVYKIFIATTNNESITAERKADGWILNGKDKALPSMVNLILYTVHEQAALYPVTQAAYEVAVKNLAAEGIKVELYNKNNEKITVFYVGGPSPNGSGTIMLTEGAKMPYVVQTPGFNGSLRARFSTRVSDWKDRTVFNVPATDIKTVTVNYPEHPLNSFTLSKANDGYTITGDPSVTTAYGQLNTERVKRYLNYFTNLNCEGYLNGLEGVDTSVKAERKMSSVDVETIKGAKYHADIYWMPLNKRSKNKITRDDVIPEMYDADRMYAVTNDNKDTVLIQTMSFFKVLRRAYEFYQKDETPKEEKQPDNVLIKNGKPQMKGVVK